MDNAKCNAERVFKCSGNPEINKSSIARIGAELADSILSGSYSDEVQQMARQYLVAVKKLPVARSSELALRLAGAVLKG